MHTDFAEENVVMHNQEMSKMFARQSDQDEEGAEDGDNDDTNESDDDGTNNDQHEETDDWMLLCRLNCNVKVDSYINDKRDVRYFFYNI